MCELRKIPQHHQGEVSIIPTAATAAHSAAEQIRAGALLYQNAHIHTIGSICNAIPCISILL